MTRDSGSRSESRDVKQARAEGRQSGGSASERIAQNQSDTDTNALKPCPFCAGEVEATAASRDLMWIEHKDKKRCSVLDGIWASAADWNTQNTDINAAASCSKGSCQRHGKCMYLNHPRCPVAASTKAPSPVAGDVVEALRAADKRLCELTPYFPPDVGPDARDVAGIEETGAVVMQIREAIAALEALPSVDAAQPAAQVSDALVERAARAIESGWGNPDTFVGKVSDTARRDARVALEAALLTIDVGEGRS